MFHSKEPARQRILSLISILVIVVSLIPFDQAAAQSATLSLSPTTGNAPTVRGSLRGSGWCTPASSVVVSGKGVSGSASIGRDGSLSGTFSVTGKPGDKVKVKVSATCRSEGSSASANFKFKSAPTPVPSTDTPTPTFTLTPTATFTPTFTPTFTYTPTPAEGEGQELVPYSGTNTLTLLGCDPQPQQLQLSFRPYLGQTGILGQPIPVPVAAGPGLGLFVFEPPPAEPGDLFEINLRVTSPDCPTEGEANLGTWTPGGSVHAIVPPLVGSTLLASSLGKYPPGSTQQEITLKGVWSANLEFSTTPQNHFQLFQWTTDPLQYDGGVLQASILPFPGTTEGDLLDPPGLVAEWEVDCSDCQFTVDVSSLAFDPPQDSQAPAVKVTLIQQIFQGVSQTFTQVLSWISGIFGKAASTPPDIPLMKSSSQQPDSLVDLVDSGKITPPLITTFYFRVVPLSGIQAAGQASTPVKIQWYGVNLAAEAIKQAQECQQNPGAPGCPTPLPAPQKPYTVEIVGYHGIVSPQDGHVGCYLVTKDATVMIGASYLKYKEGQKLCPPEPKKKTWYEAAIDIALGVIDWASAAYSDLKDTLVSIVSQFVPDALCGKTCLGTLLDAGLMALGIPPSIPNFDQLMNEGLDYLASQAVSQLGVPQEVYDSIDPGLAGTALQIAISQAEEAWKAEAEEQIKQGLKEGLEAAQYALSESVSFVPDGVPIKPDPLGDYQPPTLLLKVTRDPAIPLEADICGGKPGLNGSLGILTTVAVSQAQADLFNQQITTKNQTMKGDYPYLLYETRYVPLPELGLGESQVIPLVLRPTMYQYWGAPWTSFNDSQTAWGIWYWNGAMDLSVSNLCSVGDGIQGSPDQSFGQ